GDQLVGQAEIEGGEHLLLARRKVGHRPLDRRPLEPDLRGAVSVLAMPVVAEWFGVAGTLRCRPGLGGLMLSDDRQRPVSPSGKNEAQSGDRDFDGNRGRNKAA